MIFSSNIFLFLFLPFLLIIYFGKNLFFLRFCNKKSGLPRDKSLAMTAGNGSLAMTSSVELARSKAFWNYDNCNFHNSILLIASLIFYAFGEVSYFFLLIISIIINYFFAIFLSKSRRKKTIISIAIAINLSFLCYFKYSGFLLQNLSKISGANLEFFSPFLPHHLPIGISFFTFHIISYLVDIYRKKCEVQKNIVNLALYIVFFPQLIAGPIIRYNSIEKYLEKRKYNLKLFGYGVRIFIIGLAKKILIANNLGLVADLIFATSPLDLSTSIAWIGITFYALQIYFDFCGYSEMAIGLARIFGFKFPRNFNYPYISKSIQEFWRRWHISLSAWFRDYVYIPLGGNKNGKIIEYRNLILIFLLCGIWHGSAWTFIIWGLYHGLFLILERISLVKNFLKNLPTIFQHFYASLIILIGWVFFRSENLNYALNFLRKMFIFDQRKIVNNEINILLNSHLTLAVLAFALIAMTNFPYKIYQKFRQNKIFIIAKDFYLIFIFTLSIIALSASTYNPFIYFQF